MEAQRRVGLVRVSFAWLIGGLTLRWRRSNGIRLSKCLSKVNWLMTNSWRKLSDCFPKSTTTRATPSTLFCKKLILFARVQMFAVTDVSLPRCLLVEIFTCAYLVLRKDVLTVMQTKNELDHVLLWKACFLLYVFVDYGMTVDMWLFGRLHHYQFCFWKELPDGTTLTVKAFDAVIMDLGKSAEGALVSLRGAKAQLNARKWLVRSQS